MVQIEPKHDNLVSAKKEQTLTIFILFFCLGLPYIKAPSSRVAMKI